MSAPKLDWVETEKTEDGHYIVRPYWAGVDRPNTGGYSCGSGPKALAYARRLARAFELGTAYIKATVQTDSAGGTYVSYSQVFSMRRLPSSLKAMGV